MFKRIELLKLYPFLFKVSPINMLQKSSNFVAISSAFFFMSSECQIIRIGMQ
jgi:hypothetical protein